MTLRVKNVETTREEGADQNMGRFDFLFHYLTARGGIPKSIVRGTPGLDNPVSATAEEIASALNELAALLMLQANDPAAFYQQLTNLEGMTPACSPAQVG